MEARATGETLPVKPRRRRIVWVALPIGACLVLLGSALAARNATKTVRVASTLFVARQPVRIVPEPGERPTREDFEDYQRTQVALIKSRMVLNAAVRDEPAMMKTHLLRHQQDPMGFLEKAIQADFSLAPQILRISMVGDDPQEMAIIVNAVREAYLKEIVNREDLQRANQVDRLQKIYARFQDDLQKRRNTLRQLREALGSKDLKTQAEGETFLRKDLLDCKRELRRVRLARAGAEARAGGDKDKLREERAALNAQVRLLEEEEKQLLDQLRRRRKDSSDVESMAEEIARSEKMLGQFADRIEKLKIELQAPSRISVLEMAGLVGEK
jgi:uncharacterized protein involved in exopolysaccharide biosynthesis